MAIIDEIKTSFKEGNNLVKLLYINVAVFLAVTLMQVIFTLFQVSPDFSIVRILSVPSDIGTLLTRPWSIFTYMFLHANFLHILFNMLWLFWFGQIFLQYLDQKKLLSVYILGGFAGAALYILAFNIFPLFANSVQQSVALGASASVVAIVVAISFYVPNNRINLMFIGPVKLKYIALFTIVLDLLSITSSNAGGHIAHLGGALFGYIFIQQYKQGKNISRGFDRFMDNVFSLFQKKQNITVTHKQKRPQTDIEYNRERVKNQKEIDRILEKIATSGYDSLSKSEKETLFKANK
jgi:membrane associated rhomboid family serine protease